MKEIQELNQAILGWIPKVRTQMKTSALQFADGKTQSFIVRKRKIGNQKEFKLILSLDSHIHREFGIIDGVGFLFERHGGFVPKEWAVDIKQMVLSVSSILPEIPVSR